MFTRKYDEKTLVDAYLTHKSTTKAAQIIGCSWMTVARAVKHAGIQLDGRKHNGGTGGAPIKISTEDLIEKVKTKTVAEIAEEYHMCSSTLTQRLDRLGVQYRLGFRFGSWAQRCKAYGVSEYDDSITLQALMEKDNYTCCICGKAVDCNDREGRRIGRLYPTLDHIIPISKGGSHTWDNVQLAHMACNAGKCDRTEVFHD